MIIRKVVKKTINSRKKYINLVIYEEPTEEEIPDNEDGDYEEKIVYIDEDNDNDNIE